ncbi:MAG: TonB family protein, partial [Cyclobacteriaceae bacterium]|nr:TonB family protein [Cyclobacteriaceae bacterium]
MRVYSFVLLFTLIQGKAISQEIITLYLNSDWKITSKDHAVSVCEAEYDLENFKLNGKLSCKDLKGIQKLTLNYVNGIRNGEAKLFNHLGQPILLGNYLSNFRIGIWHYYYPNGSLKQVVKFSEDPESRQSDSNIMVGEFFDRDGKQLVINGNGRWYNDSIYHSWSDNTTMKRVTGEFKDSLKHGVWELRRMNQKQFLHLEKFKNGRLIQTTVFSERDGGTGTTSREMTHKFPDAYAKLFGNIELFKLDSTVFADSIRYLETERIIEIVTGTKYKIRNRNAGYLFGDFELMEYISRNIRYPKEARQNGYEGSVIIQLTIDAKGNPKDYMVLKGIHATLDNEALRVIRSIKDWVCALHDGQPYDKTIALPVKFEIQ